MKKFCALGIAITLTFFVSCGKQQTEAEKNAEIERQVQQRLAAERQTDEQQKLAQRESDLKAREDALKEKEQEPAQTATPQMRASDVQQREVTESEQVAHADDGETASYDTFYTKLEPYGAWRETADYGYVWQPNEAGRSRNWRPYTSGRWVYTDAGWTWHSEEPFGWATYHYGRWTRLRSVGWVWIPGNEWAPAWVSWRKGDDYVGWAPLPPEARFDHGRGIHNGADNDYDIGPDQYCFVPTNDFGAERTERAIVPVERNIMIVNQTINVTNITYNNTTIINQGPNYEELRNRTRQPIQRLRLDRRQRFEDANPHAVVRGEVIEMPAPAIAPLRPADRPRTVKEKIEKTVIDHGWSDIRDKKAAEQVRAKMKAETGAPAIAPPVKAFQPQSQLTPEPTQAAETPVRHFPDRAKMKPRPSATLSPGAIATPAPSVSRPRQEAKEAERAQKEKMRADEKARQQELEEQRKARVEKNHVPAPSPVASGTPRPTPSVKPSTAAIVPKPSPAIPLAPRATPHAKVLPNHSPPIAATKRPVVPAPVASASPASSVIASPARPAGRESKSNDKKKNKGNRESPTPSPTASGQ